MATEGQNPENAALDPKLQKALLRASGALQAEARRVVRRYSGRVSSDVEQQLLASVAAIDTARKQGDDAGVAADAQRIDELLAQHAGFARKSSLRETLENVGFAVAVALALRAALYEPFNIPSGSMFPTLQTGDHIFVNKFVHGIQIPFTTTIIGEDLFAPVGRGEVIVFRFPLDQADDYIKRVIGTPGDTLKFQGDNIWIKRPGEASYELISRTKSPKRCRDEEQPEREINGCDLYEETLDGRVYTVRYVRDSGISYQSDERIVVVPERSYLVLGDNRRRSKDSLMWMVTAPAASASALLATKDLRDLSSETEFETVSTDGFVVDSLANDGSDDAVVVRAKHASPGHVRQLALWRKPIHGGSSTYTALSRVIGESRPLRATTMGGLLQDDSKADPRLVERAKSLGMGVDRLEVAESGDTFELLAYVAPVDMVIHLRCGKLACPTTNAAGLALAEVLARVHERPEAAASELLEVPPSMGYALRSEPARTRLAGRYWQSALAPQPESTARERLEVVAVRGSFEGVAVLQEAALAQANSESKRANVLADVAGRNYVVEDANAWHLILGQESQNIFAHVRCGKRWCTDLASASAFARKVAARLPDAADQGHRLREVISTTDFSGLVEVPTVALNAYPWDQVEAQATLSSPAYEAGIEVRLRPAQGLAATLAQWSSRLQNVEAEPSFGNGGFLAQGAAGFELGLTRSEAAIRLTCGTGLCQDAAAARRLGQRIYANAAQAKNFIDETAMVPRPFVPRGNIKGRAEVIWLPLGRFGTAIP